MCQQPRAFAPLHEVSCWHEADLAEATYRECTLSARLCGLGVLMKMAMMAITSLVIATAPAMAAGFQRVTVPDPGDQPLEVGIWYPSDAPASSQPLGSFRQTDCSSRRACRRQPLAARRHIARHRRVIFGTQRHRSRLGGGRFRRGGGDAYRGKLEHRGG